MKKQELVKIIEGTVKRVLNESVDLNIPLEPLEHEIERITGIVNFKFDLKETIRDKYFNLQCTTNYADKTGVFKSILEEMQIGTFNAAYSESDPENPNYWMTINFFYVNKEGGSNSMQFLTAWYYPKEDKWVFKPVK